MSRAAAFCTRCRGAIVDETEFNNHWLQIHEKKRIGDGTEQLSCTKIEVTTRYRKNMTK